MRFLSSVTATMILSASMACAATFEFTPEGIIQNFNKALAEDNGRPLRDCQNVGHETVCNFDDKDFQIIVKFMKDNNLANGEFVLKSQFLIHEDAGQVAFVLITGDRSDPANLVTFGANVALGIKAVSGMSFTKDELAAITDKLGLMRGDDDPTTGQPVNQIEDFGEIRCSNSQSSESTKVGCLFLPRS